MAMQDAQKIKEEIITFLKLNGPSLPIQVSKYLRMDTLFTSAFLSELLSNQQLKISTLKVGSSPVYYLSGSEAGLEKYSEYLKSKEKEAYEKLKEKKFLDDDKEEPAIRIALRQIRDYAKAFENDGKIIWRYYLNLEEEYSKKENFPKKQIQEKIVKTPIKENIEKELEKQTKKGVEVEAEKHTKELERIIPPEKENLFLNPLAKKETLKKEKEKPKSEFVKKTIEFIQKKEWTLVKEFDYKSKEYDCLVEIQTELGPITFKTIAKEKKTINETDLMKLLSDSQTIPLPGLFLSTGDVQKKALNFLDKYASVLKFKKIE